MSKKGSKNDAKNRNSGALPRRYNGRPVAPFLFDGKALGLGNFIAGKYKDGDGAIILDKNGVPIPYNSFQETDETV